MTKSLLVWMLGSLVFPVCPLLYGQATGSFSGTVFDKTGSVISGAQVRATSQGTNISRESRTDYSGHYLMALLPIGDYTIRVESQGFGIVEQKDIRLQVDERRELNFTLTPSTVTQSVEVSSTELAVQTTDPTLGQVITSEEVAHLPLNGRNFVQLATLTPGTTQETNPNSFFGGGPSSEVSARGTFSLSVGGSRVQVTDWLLDGNDNNELSAGGIAILPSLDAIQEFKVLTFNYSAQYGTRAGPTVLVITKSGSNQLHGSLFEYFRNTDLDALSRFATTSTEKFNLNQFGGSLGGAIQKDKTFFFVDYQERRQRRATPFNGFVPTAAMRAGDFSHDVNGNLVTTQLLYNPYTSTTGGGRAPFQCVAPRSTTPTAVNADGSQVPGFACNAIPAALINPISQQLINLYPGVNSNNANFNFGSAPTRTINEGEFDVRIDHTFSSKDTAFARFSYDQATSFVPGGSPGFAEAGTFASTQNITNHGRNVAVSETHIFSANTVNQISGGFNRIFNFINSFGDGTCESAKLGIPGANLSSTCSGFPGGAPPGLSQATAAANVSSGLTSLNVGGGFWSLGDRGFAPFQGGTNVFTIADSFDMIRGKHHIRTGGEVRGNQLNVLTNAFQDGFYVFSSLWSGSGTGAGGNNAADFLLGLPSVGLHDQTFRGATTGRRWKLFRPYIQDDWRVTSNLTVNLGLAWAFVRPITESENRYANFDFQTGVTLIPGVNSDSQVGVRLDRKALEPRIGLAWKAFGSQRTAVRAGYAIFHDSSWNQGAQGLWQNPPFFAESDFFGFSIGGCPSATAPSGQASFCNTTGGFGAPGAAGVTGRSISQGFPLFTQPPSAANFTGTFYSQNRNFRIGTVQQFNLNVENQLPGDVVLTVGYAGSRSAHILVDGLNLNVGSPSACGVVRGYTLGCGPGGTAFSAPYGGSTVSNINDIGSARYDSLQVKAETKSARHGLYALLSYTFAHSYDTGLSDGGGTLIGGVYYPLPGTQRADLGLSQIQLNHNFSASVLYDLPFGKGKRFGSTWGGPMNTVFGNWQVNVIEKILSGFPLFVAASNNTTGVNFSDDGNSLNRADEVGNPEKAGPVLANPNVACHTTISQGGIAPDRIHTNAAWFNPCAFADPPQGELGTASRAPIYGPGFVNTDFSAIKHFRVTEATDLEFRAELFNLFNHPQLYLPGNPSINNLQDVDSPSTFGTVTQIVNNPRLIQFALRLRF